MKATVYCLITVALWANLPAINLARGDEPNPSNDPPSNAPAAAVPANPAVPAQDLPPSAQPAAKLTLRDKLLHWPAIVHSKPPCKDCGLTDPDFCCMSCRSQWIFLFGSCRAFYGDNNRAWR